MKDAATIKLTSTRVRLGQAAMDRCLREARDRGITGRDTTQDPASSERTLHLEGDSRAIQNFKVWLIRNDVRVEDLPPAGG